MQESLEADGVQALGVPGEHVAALLPAQQVVPLPGRAVRFQDTAEMGDVAVQIRRRTGGGLSRPYGFGELFRGDGLPRSKKECREDGSLPRRPQRDRTVVQIHIQRAENMESHCVADDDGHTSGAAAKDGCASVQGYPDGHVFHELRWPKKASPQRTWAFLEDKPH
ncbi:hypothetical protein GCM10023347_15320 [Streptomyces chumphonensis]